MRLFLLSVLVLSSLAAQELPDGAALMKRQEGANKNHQSMQFVTEMTMEFVRNGQPQQMSGSVSMAYQNPGRMRLESSMQGVVITVVSDGESTWAYNSMSRQYTKQPAAPGIAGIMAMLGVRNLPDMSKTPMTSKTLREEKLQVDGQDHDCWLVEAKIGKMAVPGAQGSQITEGVMDYWIDQKSEVALKIQTSMKMTAPGMTEPMEMRQTMTKHDLRIDQPIPDSFFAFAPPPDAKEVPELFGVGLPRTDLTGKPAAAFDVKGLDAKPYSLAAMKGKPVLLDFWATWCGPCRNSMPVLDRISREYKDQGLVVLGVDAGEDRKTVEAFLKNKAVAYPTILGGDSEILSLYNVSAYPTFILIGRDGQIVAHQVGYGGETALRGMLAKAGLAAKAK